MPWARVADTLGVDLSLPTLLATFVLLAALRSAVAWRREMHVAAIRHAFTDRLRERLYTTTAAAAWPVLVERRQSNLLHALTHDVNRAGQGAMLLIQGRSPRHSRWHRSGWPSASCRRSGLAWHWRARCCSRRPPRSCGARAPSATG